MENRLSVAPDGRVYEIPSEREVRTSFHELVERAENYNRQGRQVVVVQGLGFVGAAVVAAVADAVDSSQKPLYFVIGVDLPTPEHYWKVACLNDGKTPIISPDPQLQKLIEKAVCETGNLCATVSEQTYALADVIIVDIPLDVRDPLRVAPEEIQVDLRTFESSIRTIGRSMKPNALVLVETTVPIGFCEKLVLPVLKEERERRGVSEPLSLAHAYERVMPGPDYVDSIRRFWRTFSGIDESSAGKAEKFLSSFIDTANYPLYRLEEPTASELAKLLENSYRQVNIAFIYEWTLLAEKIGIDLFSVIDSIRVRKGTHDNMRLPGFGVGGYCLTKDSLLVQWGAKHLFDTNVVLEMTLEALRINHRMPLHTLDLLLELGDGSLAGRKIAVCGVSYLPELADTRNSPSEIFIDELIKAKAELIVHDPYVMHWDEKPEIAITQDLTTALRRADGIVFTVGHRAYLDLTAEKMIDYFVKSPFIVDTQNIISDLKAEALHKSGCRLSGVGKGHWRKRGYQCPK
ncbi:MAG TPA: nucleotide sugar dehydrogenase [archaeon]|nr:nucleotide sugar dehydrogenase [archaeon]